MTTLQRLNEILELATREGLLDDLQGYCKNPDSINDVCDAVDALLQDRPRVNKEDFEGNAILRVGGNPFRCPCGGNVFAKHTKKPYLYCCNSCGSIFEGEK